MAHLALNLMGPFHATLGNEPISGLQSPRLQALLAYLTVEADRTHVRRALAEMLWPRRPEGEALEALRYALSNLRTALQDREAEPPFLHITRTTLQFNLDSDSSLDVQRFHRQLAAAEGVPDTRVALETLRRAVELYRDDFLTDLCLPTAGPFEEWVLVQRERLARQLASALQRLACTHERGGAYGEAEVWSRRWLQLEPWNEVAHRQLMRTLALSGQRARALAQYETCRQQLIAELGIEPEPGTQTLYRMIRIGELGALTCPGTQGLSAPSNRPDEVSAPFVAREEELARLERLLEEVLTGRGRVVFVTGETGSGKTALWRIFAHRAMEAHGDLVVVAGHASAPAGAGDPYLPFREILQSLAGDVEPQRAGGTITPAHARRLWALFPDTVQALVTYGPDLVGHFIPGKRLLSRATVSVSRGASWLPQLRALVESTEGRQESRDEERLGLFEQVTDVLRRLARDHPLVLVVDDLQWADRGSCSLFCHLGQRLRGSRVLLVGLFRSGALTWDAGRHPLSSIVNELQRSFGEVPIDLDRSSRREFVDTYLDTEPNRLGERFREALTRHTGGNPLFTVETLRMLQERGTLAQDESGRWVAEENLDWGRLPARVEAVVAERLQRLAPSIRQLLNVASVAGETFATEVLAQVLAVDELEILHRLNEPLSEQRRLVELQRVERRSLDGRRLTYYQFRHSLFQKFCYRQLSEAERAQLHGRVGTALEALCTADRERLASHAPLLAHHFQEAGRVRKAIHYRQLAGEWALWVSTDTAPTPPGWTASAKRAQGY